MKYIDMSIERGRAILVMHGEVLNREMTMELAAIMGSLTHDPSVEVVIFTGAGEVFLKGVDLEEHQKLSPAEICEFSGQVKNLLWAMASLPQVTIAAVNGTAEAIGCAAALCCDIRIASQQARFTHPDLSIVPSILGPQQLFRLIGPGYAKEMIFVGEPVYAARAYEIGLVNRVTGQKELLAKATGMAEKICKNGNYLLKQVLDSSSQLELKGRATAQ